jgi:hypothetical protein
MHNPQQLIELNPMKISNNPRISLAFAAILLFGVAPIRGQEATPVVSLPVATTSTNVSNFTVPVTTTEVQGDDHVVFFEVQFTYDSTIIDIPTNTAVTKAGLTTIPDPDLWDVYGANISQVGSIKTYVAWVMSYDWDNTFISGSGTLFNLTINRVTSTGGSTDLTHLDDCAYWDNNFTNPYPTVCQNGRINVLCLLSCP